MKGRIARTSIMGLEGCTENRAMTRDGLWTPSAVLQGLSLQADQWEATIWMKGQVAGSCASAKAEMCISEWSGRRGRVQCP